MEIENTLFWIGHASFYIKAKDATIFIDPFKVPDAFAKQADIVLITHAHFDHCSKEDIKRVLKDGAGIIAAPGCLDKAEFPNLTIAKPGFKTEFKGMEIEAVPAYNVKQERLHHHPRSNDWVGYVINVEGKTIYHAGDTDFIDEMKSMRGIGAALLPAGGTYTMDCDEAIEAAKAIKPEIFIPMHYKNLLGKEGSRALEEKAKAALSNALVLKEVIEPTYGF